MFYARENDDIELDDRSLKCVVAVLKQQAQETKDRKLQFTNKYDQKTPNEHFVVIISVPFQFL